MLFVAMDDLSSLALMYDHLQCDEGKPRCSACTRHGVSCEYVFAPPRGTPQEQQQGYQTPPSDIPYNVQGQRRDADDPNLDPLLEMRLVHEWTANVCKTFTTAWEFWVYQVRKPLSIIQLQHLLIVTIHLGTVNCIRVPPCTGLDAGSGCVIRFETAADAVDPS
jgi:hypothetical protein